VKPSVPPSICPSSPRVSVPDCRGVGVGVGLADVDARAGGARVFVHGVIGGPVDDVEAEGDGAVVEGGVLVVEGAVGGGLGVGVVGGDAVATSQGGEGLVAYGGLDVGRITRAGSVFDDLAESLGAVCVVFVGLDAGGFFGAEVVAGIGEAEAGVAAGFVASEAAGSQLGTEHGVWQTLRSQRGRRRHPTRHHLTVEDGVDCTVFPGFCA
jgi:hypothetical protein